MMHLLIGVGLGLFVAWLGVMAFAIGLSRRW